MGYETNLHGEADMVEEAQPARQLANPGELNAWARELTGEEVGEFKDGWGIFTIATESLQKLWAQWNKDQCELQVLRLQGEKSQAHSKYQQKGLDDAYILIAGLKAFQQEMFERLLGPGDQILTDPVAYRRRVVSVPYTGDYQPPQGLFEVNPVDDGPECMEKDLEVLFPSCQCGADFAGHTPGIPEWCVFNNQICACTHSRRLHYDGEFKSQFCKTCACMNFILDATRTVGWVDLR